MLSLDRVAGVVHGGLYPNRGAFAEYLKIDSNLAWKVPDDVDDAAAATFGISAATVMLALNARLGLPYPGEKQDVRQQKTAPTIFIYAGSTAAGLFVIQIAKLAGYTVVTTASPHSTDLVKSYGADTVFDYHDPDVATAITKQYPDISIALDCFSKGKSFEISDEVLKNSKGKFITLLQPPKPKYPGVEHELILAYTLFGHPFQSLPPVGPKWPAFPNDRKALARFYATLPRLMSNKKLRAPPIYLEEGGVEWNLDRTGQVAGG